MDTSQIPRRSFILRSAALIGSLTGLGMHARPREVHDQEKGIDTVETWLKGLDAPHKQFFDAGAIGGGAPLGRVCNFLDVYAEAYGLTDKDINVVFGASGASLPFIFNDAMWGKYDLGRRYGAENPQTREPLMRNLFRKDLPGKTCGDHSIEALQRRGVRFIGCNRSLRNMAIEIATNLNGNADLLRDDLLANIVPGVVVVPAMVVAANRAQEAGMTYVYVE